jgi:cobalt/nickel transport system ATP-binding protein
VALASVLALNPEVLLLDEPFARLDPRMTRRVSDLLAGLKAAGKTIILATHDLARASSLADKVVVLAEDGSLLATDSPATVLGDNDLLSRANLI